MQFKCPGLGAQITLPPHSKTDYCPSETFQGRHLRLAGFMEQDVLTFPKAVNNPQNRPPNLSANGSPRGRFNPLELGAGLRASVGIWGLDSWQQKCVRQAGGVSSGAWSQMPQEKVVNSQHC